jgi:hypothetical protein
VRNRPFSKPFAWCIAYLGEPGDIIVNIVKRFLHRKPSVGDTYGGSGSYIPFLLFPVIQFQGDSVGEIGVNIVFVIYNVYSPVIIFTQCHVDLQTKWLYGCCDIDIGTAYNVIFNIDKVNNLAKLIIYNA